MRSSQETVSESHQAQFYPAMSVVTPEPVPAVTRQNVCREALSYSR